MKQGFYIAADHAGYDLKQQILEFYPDMIDLGTDSSDTVDYPDVARKLADQLEKDRGAFGILVCGSGIGVCMAANRFKHIRAANCVSPEMAKLAREHNDANVLCLPGRLLSVPDALAIVDAFLNTPFSKEPRHQNRIQKMSQLVILGKVQSTADREPIQFFEVTMGMMVIENLNSIEWNQVNGSSVSGALHLAEDDSMVTFIKLYK